jgi:hypothetical protein
MALQIFALCIHENAESVTATTTTTTTTGNNEKLWLEKRNEFSCLFREKKDIVEIIFSEAENGIMMMMFYFIRHFFTCCCSLITDGNSFQIGKFIGLENPLYGSFQNHIN